MDDPALAIAGSRAGAIGIFNAAGHTDAAKLPGALAHLALHARNAWGIRLPDADCVDVLALQQQYAAAGLRWLIVATLDEAKSLQGFRQAGGKLLLECTEWGSRPERENVDGLILPCAEDALSAPLARACSEVSVPVYAMGNLGLRAHSVCVAAGAQGIVYGTQLTALAESSCAARSASGSRALDWAQRFSNVADALRASRRALERDLALLIDQRGGVAHDELLIVPATMNPADVVADAGEAAVPVICLDVASDVNQQLASTAERVGDRAWGVVLDGALQSGLLAERLALCRSAGASFCLLQHAQPDQALAALPTRFPVFLPVNSASELERCLRQGATRFLLAPDSLDDWTALEDTLSAQRDSGPKAGRLTALLRVQGEVANDAARNAALLAPLAALGIHTGFVAAVEDRVALPDRNTLRALRKRRLHTASRERRRPSKPADIAIIGIGCKLPRAGDPVEYWENILDRVNGIREIPAERWDWRLYFDKDRHAEDRIYSRWGGFIDDVAFDPVRFGMPPKSVAAIDPMQLMALEVVRQTLEDAGYAKREFNRERVSIVLGTTGGTGDVGAQYAVRAETPRYAGTLPEEVASRLPQWSEDSFAGILLNVTAGRAANRFNFGGVNFTVDAACASSLTAVYQAVTELESGRSDMAIAGGVDTVQGPFGYLCFSKTQALSPGGQCNTFDESADGIVISEGIAMVALKRLADAERDGDRIYAVIKGVGGSSDGRARSMTAPHPDGQVRALQRAYEHAGYSPATVGLFEAHGTGTVAGDTAELETVVRVLEEAGAKAETAVIGSVKTLIGHTKAAAGIAGLVKTALAVYHGVQPPHAVVTRPNPRVSGENSPLSPLPRARPWITSPDAPRRASVSAFGFGGTNFHVTMEQYGNDFLPELKPSSRRRWPAELLVWRGASATALAASLRATAGWLATNPRPRLCDLAWTLQKAATTGGLTASMVVSDIDGLNGRLRALAKHVEDTAQPLPADAFFAARPLSEEGGIAVVFAGQGAQYPDMLRQLAIAFDELGETLSRADVALGEPVSKRVYPAGRYDDESRHAAASALAAPATALPALAAMQAGMLMLCRRIGVQPMMAAGYSFGEYTALFAAGVLSLDDLLLLAQARGEVLAASSDNYALASVACSYDELVEAAARVGDVWVASHTAPGRCTVSGVRTAVLALLEQLKSPGEAVPTPMAVHTPLAAATARQLAQRAQPANCNAPEMPVYCNATAQPYPANVDALLQQFNRQLACPVRFVEQIEAMYDAGARIFLGLGPGNGQGSPIVDILGDRPCLAVHVDDGDGGMIGFLRCAAALLAHGVQLDFDALSGNRDCRLLDMNRPDPNGRGPDKKPLPGHYWLLNGSSARPAAEAARRSHSSVEMSSPPKNPSTIEQNTVPGKKGTAHKWEYGPMSTSARDLPAQSPDSSADTSTEHVQNGERDAVFQAYQETMRQFLRAQESVMLAYLNGGTQAGDAALPRPVDAPRTLTRQRTVANRPAPVPLHVAEPPAGVIAPAPPSSAGMPVVPEPAPAPVDTRTAGNPAAAPAGQGMGEGVCVTPESVRRQLLDLVAERTGYPQDMLKLDLHIEADLGIDSIKRVEIVGALIRALPQKTAGGNRELAENLNAQTTLQAMIDVVCQQASVAVASNQ